MKKLTLTLALILTGALAMAQNGFAVHGKGKGTNIGDVSIEAAKSGDNVRGRFGTVVRVNGNALALRGQIVRLAQDANRPHVFNFVAECKDANGAVYRVEGSCLDGPNPERDDIVFTIGQAGNVIFRGTTDRQIVNVRRFHG